MRISGFKLQILNPLPRRGLRLFREGGEFFTSHRTKEGLPGCACSLRSVTFCLWALAFFSIWTPVALAQDVSVTAELSPNPAGVDDEVTLTISVSGAGGGVGTSAISEDQRIETRGRTFSFHPVSTDQRPSLFVRRASRMCCCPKKKAW